MTVAAGLIFTVFWISGGFEQHYRVTESKTEFLVNQSIINDQEKESLLILEGHRFVSSTKFETALKNNLEDTGDEKKLAVITSAFTAKGIPARLTTFVFSLLVAIFSTFIISPSGSNRPSRP